MKYHHIGIPTDIPRENETYLPEYKVFVSGYETSLYGVEWMRYEPDSPLPELVKTVPHIAFEVDSVMDTIKDKEILIKPNSPSEGTLVAFIIENGAPIEFIEIKKAT